jgi:heme a synthase
MRHITLAATLLALFVVVLGAYVRLSDAGLGCPDWPGCYGRIVPPTDSAAVNAANAAYPERAVEVGKAWKEQVHRYAASLLGLLILALAALAARRGEQPAGKIPYVLVALVIFQGMLGMWTVTLLLKPLVVTAHLLGGLTTLALLWWTYLRLTPSVAQLRPSYPNAPRGWLYGALLVLGLQIALGGWTSTNYAAWACGTSFPDCHGRLWPDMDFATGFTLWHGLGIDYEFGILSTPARTAIHFSHRLFAIVASAVLLLTAWRLLKAPPQSRLPSVGVALVGLLALQLALGVSNVIFGLPLPVAVAHNGGAALLLLCLVSGLAITQPVAVAGRATAPTPAFAPRSQTA